MIDFGKIIRVVIFGAAKTCGIAELFVKRMRDTSWADNIYEEDLPLWEQFLNIYSAGQSVENRRKVILAYLNTKGTPKIEWFYELAKRLGYKRGVYTENGGWEFDEEYFGPAVFLADGEYLPFRTDISFCGDEDGDMVYDNINYGAATCTCYYRNGDSPDDLSLQLKDLLRAARSIGTVMVFSQTEFGKIRNQKLGIEKLK